MMGEFFRGWRRKTGAVVLAMACGLATIWVRSLTTVDCGEVYTRFEHHRWKSQRGTLEYSSYDHGQVIAPRDRWRFSFGNYLIDPETHIEYPSIHRSLPTWKYLGFYVRRQHDPKQFEFQFRYASAVIPLILISAYLLPTKPYLLKNKKLGDLPKAAAKDGKLRQPA